MSPAPTPEWAVRWCAIRRPLRRIVSLARSWKLRAATCSSNSPARQKRLPRTRRSSNSSSRRFSPRSRSHGASAPVKERIMTSRPDSTEAAAYYFKYIDLVPAGDICAVLESQSAAALASLQAISAEASLHRYAPGKWSVREMLGHINDTERLFVSCRPPDLDPGFAPAIHPRNDGGHGEERGQSGVPGN